MLKGKNIPGNNRCGVWIPDIMEMMHKRWETEENIFRQLKTYYYAKFCYDHKVVEEIFDIVLLLVNICNSIEM